MPARLPAPPLSYAHARTHARMPLLALHRVRFLCSAEAMPFELFENIQTQAEARQARGGGGAAGSSYSGGGSGSAYSSSPSGSSSSVVVDDNLGFAKDRTISRLTEMQSEE